MIVIRQASISIPFRLELTAPGRVYLRVNMRLSTVYPDKKMYG
jgi:hypothetical protein